MIRTFTYSLAVSALFPILCLGQTKGSAASTVSSNARATDDPRVGLKPGLYDAGEAIFGLVKVASLPKPAGSRSSATSFQTCSRHQRWTSRAEAEASSLRVRPPVNTARQTRSQALQWQSRVRRQLQRY